MRGMITSRIFALALILCAAATGGCKKDAPKSTRWDDAAAAVAQPPGDADAAAAVPLSPAGTLNKFFPKDGEGGWKRVSGVNESTSRH